MILEKLYHFLHCRRNYYRLLTLKPTTSVKLSGYVFFCASLRGCQRRRYFLVIFKHALFLFEQVTVHNYVEPYRFKLDWMTFSTGVLRSRLARLRKHYTLTLQICLWNGPSSSKYFIYCNFLSFFSVFCEYFQFTQFLDITLLNPRSCMFVMVNSEHFSSVGQDFKNNAHYSLKYASFSRWRPLVYYSPTF